METWKPPLPITKPYIELLKKNNIALPLDTENLTRILDLLDNDSDNEIPGDEAYVGVRYATKLLREVFKLRQL